MNTKYLPYCASFDLNKQLTSFLHEVINQQVDFLPVLNKKRGCTCVYARMVGKMMAKKSTKQQHFGAVSFTKHYYNTKQTSVV